MKFSTTALIGSILALAVATPVENNLSKRSVTWNVKETDASMDVDAATACLDGGLGDGKWHDAYVCGDWYWQIQGHSYNSPTDCFNACHDDFYDGIVVQQAIDQECDAYAGVSAHCWMQMWPK